MCDPLKLLRNYNIKRKEIVEKGNRYIFGKFAIKKTMKTSVTIHGTKKKDYYTLECLVYFLKYSSLKHVVYVRQAAIDKIPAVLKEDRRSILTYLFGHTTFCEAVDQNVPLSEPAKKPRLDLLDRLDLRVDLNRKKEFQNKKLRDVMSSEKIAAIRQTRAKYLAKKQSRQNQNKTKEMKTYNIRVKNMNGRF